MLSLTSLEKIVFLLVENYYSCGSGRVGWSGGRVGWLDNLEIMLNSVQLSWKLTELGNCLVKNILTRQVDRDILNTQFFKVTGLLLKNWVCHAHLNFKIQKGVAGTIFELRS